MSQLYINRCSKMVNAVVLIFLYISISSAIEISSKIDFDSDVPAKESSSSIIIVLDDKFHEINDTFQTPFQSKSRLGGEHLRGTERSMHTGIYYNSVLNQSKEPENIYIVVNGNGIASSIPTSVDCKDNVCETTVTTTDDKGNSITVSVSVLTESKRIVANDVPVVNGIRASGYGDDRNTPTFVPDNGRGSNPHFINNIIPQRQAPRRNVIKSQSGSFYPRNNYGPRRESPAWNTWIAGRKAVDDKIEPPFSKTNSVWFDGNSQ